MVSVGQELGRTGWLGSSGSESQSCSLMVAGAETATAGVAGGWPVSLLHVVLLCSLLLASRAQYGSSGH